MVAAVCCIYENQASILVLEIHSVPTATKLISFILSSINQKSTWHNRLFVK